MWNCIERDGALSDLLRRHVKTEFEKRRNADAIKAEAKQRFNTLCRKDYDGLWAMVTAQMNEAAVVWNPEARPVDSNGFVKGTRTKMPSRDPPLTMHEALLDQRPDFNRIRYGYIECQGGDLLVFQRQFLHVLNQFQPELWDRQEIQDFVTAIAKVVALSHGEVSPPADFIDLVWPHYIHGYIHGGLGRQYWLSYDELLALATVARVNLVIVSERAGCFHYVGDNLASVADPEQRIVLSSIRGEGAGAIESHFERLMPLFDVRPARGLCTGVSHESHSNDDNAAASIVRARPMNDFGRSSAQHVSAEKCNRKVECSLLQNPAGAIAGSSEVQRDQPLNPAQPDFVDNLLEEFENSVRQDSDAELEASSSGERPPGLSRGGPSASHRPPLGPRLAPV